MANDNRPMGLSPVRYLNAAPWHGGGNVYCIPNTDDTNAYAIGDPVKLAGGADANGVATITLCAAGGGAAAPILGVIVSGAGALSYGSSYGVPQDSPLVIPATKSRDYYVLVCDDPNVIFEVQEVGTGTALTAAAVGLNCDLVAGANGGYLSGWMLNNATEADTATLDCKLLGLAQRSGNAFGAYAKWLVLINNHQFRYGIVGIS